MSTLLEIKAAAASLPAQERVDLIEWLNKSKEVLELRREQLRREIRIGLDQMERGEFSTCRNDAEVAEFFAGVKARGRAARADQQSGSKA